MQTGIPDPHEVFDGLMKFLYGMKLEVGEQNWEPLLDQANYYQITAFLDQFERTIYNFLTKENVFRIYPQAVKISSESAENACIDFPTEILLVLIGKNRRQI